MNNMFQRHTFETALVAVANMALGSALRSQGLPPMTIGLLRVAIGSVLPALRPVRLSHQTV